MDMREVNTFTLGTGHSAMGWGASLALHLLIFLEICGTDKESIVIFIDMINTYLITVHIILNTTDHPTHVSSIFSDCLVTDLLNNKQKQVFLKWSNNRNGTPSILCDLKKSCLLINLYSDASPVMKNHFLSFALTIEK